MKIPYAFRFYRTDGIMKEKQIAAGTAVLHADFEKPLFVSPFKANTMTKLRRDEEVTLTVLGKICKTLNADYGDIMEYIDEEDT